MYKVWIKRDYREIPGIDQGTYKIMVERLHLQNGLNRRPHVLLHPKEKDVQLTHRVRRMMTREKMLRLVRKHKHLVLGHTWLPDYLLQNTTNHNLTIICTAGLNIQTAP
jgi:hypothetical protein